jgi:hypothetical protein
MIGRLLPIIKLFLFQEKSPKRQNILQNKILICSPSAYILKYK